MSLLQWIIVPTCTGDNGCRQPDEDQAAVGPFATCEKAETYNTQHQIKGYIWSLLLPGFACTQAARELRSAEKQARDSVLLASWNKQHGEQS